MSQPTGSSLSTEIAVRPNSMSEGFMSEGFMGFMGFMGFIVGELV